MSIQARGSILAVCLATCLLMVTPVFAGTVILNSDHYFGTLPNGQPEVIINVEVTTISGGYLWQYTVTNNGFASPTGCVPTTTICAANGFSGFALMLANGDAISNITTPPGDWEVNAHNEGGGEFDKPGTDLDPWGILPGDTGVFSFETQVLNIIASDGWFHTWFYRFAGDQVTLFNSQDGAACSVGPCLDRVEIPDTANAGPGPSIPEPASMLLVASGLLGAVKRLRKQA